MVLRKEVVKVASRQLSEGDVVRIVLGVLAALASIVIAVTSLT